ncbi:hypothetical protein HDU87_005098 [Geranomyces variabilis]|uniref:Uncharacterized protein n=1 Tax=Geranomyces variabilis TaxID=109894 RepID=A0AAD5XTF0_9FUNG|nr:hypothetical protein HDU87_005098 [Geranomyces variabilis]
MRIATILALSFAAVASASNNYHPSYSPQISVQLADSYNVQVLGNGGVNKEGCFNIVDDADPMKQAGVVHAMVNSNDITAFFYTSPDCVRATRIFKKPEQEVKFSENPLLARSVRIINPELMKQQQADSGNGAKARGVNAWNSWINANRYRGGRGGN